MDHFRDPKGDPKGARRLIATQQWLAAGPLRGCLAGGSGGQTLVE